jgi:hypothetical protein
MATIRVTAVHTGYSSGTFRDVGDVFDIDSSQYSDSSVSFVPVGNPDYPLYGWQIQVPSSTPLYSYALANGGQSSQVTTANRGRTVL